MRYVRLHSANATSQNSTYDIVLTQELSKSKYEGIGIRSRDTGFNREYTLDLDEIFNKERSLHKDLDMVEASSAPGSKLERFIGLSPTAYGKIFMVHYAIQVSLKHPGLFT